jgi:hypothetical protein
MNAFIDLYMKKMWIEDSWFLRKANNNLSFRRFLGNRFAAEDAGDSNCREGQLHPTSSGLGAGLAV